MATAIAIRRASPDDAASIAGIWKTIVAEQSYSAVDRPFSVETEREYLTALSSREAIFVAETGDRKIIGFQSLDQWTKLFHSMDHVGQLGTFVLREWRRRGVGRQLAAHTIAFARSSGYEKLVIFVRASNADAQAFYARLGFVRCGRLVRQVKIAGRHDDEVVMELLFSTT